MSGMDSTTASAPDPATESIPEAPVLLDSRREAEFAEQGFTVIPLFDPSDMEEIRRELTAVVEGVTPPNHGPIYLSFFDGDEARRARLQRASQQTFGSALRSHVAGGRIQNYGAVIKSPRARKLPIHHHTPVTDCFLQREIICWCPLSDVDADSGAMRFIPRSHHILPYVRLPRGTDYYSSFAGVLEKLAVTLPLPAGTAVLFENSILHGSCANRQDRTRLAITCQIVPTAARNGLCLEGPEGWIDFIEATPSAALESYVETGVRSDQWPAAKRIPNRNRQITPAEFLALLESPAKATESLDPLDAVRASGSATGGLGARAKRLLEQLGRRS